MSNLRGYLSSIYSYVPIVPNEDATISKESFYI